MIKFITNNFWAKAVCVLLAMAVWIYVGLTQSRIAEFPGLINLEMRNVPAGMVAIADSSTVQIKISADQAQWKQLTANSFAAYIDLNGATEGTHEMDVKVNINVAGVQLVSVTPSKVMVTVEPMVSKKVPVISKVEGTAGDGLVAGDIKIDPNEVIVSGAQSALNKIFEAIAIIKLNGETEEFNKSIDLVALDSEGEVIKNVTFNPSNVKVTVPIIKAGTTKTVGIKANITGQPKSGYWVSQVKITPADITINGQSNILQTTNYLETKEINIDGLDANKTQTVEINVPSGVTIVGDTSKVKVEITIDPIQTAKTINLGYNWQNLASNLKIDSVNPNSITVTLSGTADVLNKITADNTKLNIDLSGYKYAGSYNIDLDKSQFNLLDGVSVLSFAPSAITVILNNK